MQTILSNVICPVISARLRERKTSDEDRAVDTESKRGDDPLFFCSDVIYLLTGKRTKSTRLFEVFLACVHTSIR